MTRASASADLPLATDRSYPGRRDYGWPGHLFYRQTPAMWPGPSVSPQPQL
jgi:hypothetical protein